MTEVPKSRKWKPALLSSAFFVIGVVGLWFVYSPTHWMRKVDFGTATVDGKPVDAQVYFGSPNHSEAEAFALVHLEKGGDYFLDFGSEKVRPVRRSDYLRLVGGVWSIRSMKAGEYREPLPFVHLNEFRIRAENGQVVSVQF